MVAPTLTIPRRMEVIQAFKESGGSIAAVLPIHYPRSLFRAFDILPVEVWGPPNVNSNLGSRHLQPYVCSIVRNALSFLQSGGLDVADFLVVPHTCDSLQGLASIMIDFITPHQPVLPIYLPRGMRESDLVFLADEFGCLYKQLAESTGRHPNDDDLMASIVREEAADALLDQLYRQRTHMPLGDLDFYKAIRSREYLPAQQFAEFAQELLATTTTQPSLGTPLLISGIVPEPMELFSVISEIGGRVVADDLACCGRRRYPAGKSEDPFRRMAERIIFAPPDPTRGSSIAARSHHLVNLAESTKAQGVIFYDVKFCEPELFDLPELRSALRQAGFPSLAIEVDISDPLPDQIRNRLESFMEMLQ
jgi:benzoyl-CoA reductase/2-hydroxyglutaryl-CoA dehydratase subunit BcrC/BadD/HgdB